MANTDISKKILEAIVQEYFDAIKKYEPGAYCHTMDKDNDSNNYAIKILSGDSRYNRQHFGTFECINNEFKCLLEPRDIQSYFLYFNDKKNRLTKEQLKIVFKEISNTLDKFKFGEASRVAGPMGFPCPAGCGYRICMLSQTELLNILRDNTDVMVEIF
jgi:hypothetical protein